MKISRTLIVGVFGAMIVSILTGCGAKQWNDLKVGRSTAGDVEEVFKTNVDSRDRYAYVLSKSKLNSNVDLVMVDLDVDGIVMAKYCWRFVPSPILPLGQKDAWQIDMETQLAPTELQKYTATLGPREEAILEYFGRILFDTSRHFQDINEVFGISNSMKQILVFAVDEYNARSDRPSLLGEKGFEFDAGVFGDRSSMVLKTIDERQGLYSLRLKGHRTCNFSASGD